MNLLLQKTVFIIILLACVATTTVNFFTLKQIKATISQIQIDNSILESKIPKTVNDHTKAHLVEELSMVQNSAPVLLEQKIEQVDLLGRNSAKRKAQMKKNSQKLVEYTSALKTLHSEEDSFKTCGKAPRHQKFLSKEHLLQANTDQHQSFISSFMLKIVEHSDCLREELGNAGLDIDKYQSEFDRTLAIDAYLEKSQSLALERYNYLLENIEYSPLTEKIY